MHEISLKKNSLKITEENTKESHIRVVSLCVIKTHLVFFYNFLDLENINFQTFFANYRIEGFVFLRRLKQ